MLANVAMVWRELFSHVEGVVGRRRRVWMTGRPLAPSPVAVVVLSERYYGLGKGSVASFLSHMLTPPVERGLGVDCVNLQMIHMSIKVHALRSSEPSQAPPANLPMAFL